MMKPDLLCAIASGLCIGAAVILLTKNIGAGALVCSGIVFGLTSIYAIVKK